MSFTSSSWKHYHKLRRGSLPTIELDTCGTICLVWVGLLLGFIHLLHIPLKKVIICSIKKSNNNELVNLKIKHRPDIMLKQYLCKKPIFVFPRNRTVPELHSGVIRQKWTFVYKSRRFYPLNIILKLLKIY